MRPIGLIVLSALSITAGSLGCQPGFVGQAIRPTDITASQALEEEQAPSCVDVAPYSEPLIVDWRSKGRLDLEIAMRSGVAVVAYDCDRFELLTNCKLKGSYSFAAVSRKEEVIQLKNEDEVKANLPLSGAKLGAGLERGAAIDLALVLVGKKTTTVSDAWREQLVGDNCRRATHFVRAATVGAFAVQKGSVGRARAAAELFGAEIGGQSRSERQSKMSDGSLEACRTSSPRDPAPPDECRAAVRLELVPVQEGAPKLDAPKSKSTGLKAKENPCPEGLVLTKDKCMVDTGDPHLCAPDDVGGCEAQCNRGHADSCLNLAVALMYKARSEQDAQRIIAATNKACAGGNLTGCSASAFMYGKCRAKSNPCVRRDLAKSRALYTKACDAGYGQACQRLAGDIQWEKYGRVTPERAKEITTLYERSCKLGHHSGCWDLSSLYMRGEHVERDVVRAIELLRRSCDDGHLRSCSKLGRTYSDGRQISKDFPRAARHFQTVCDAGQIYGCLKAARIHDKGARGVPKDEAKARRLYEQACFPKKKQPPGFDGPPACHRLGQMLHDAVGGPADKRLAARAYDEACRVDTRYCVEASEVFAERSVDLLAEGCSRLGRGATCEALEKRDLERAKRVYGAKCAASELKTTSACESAKRLGSK